MVTQDARITALEAHTARLGEELAAVISAVHLMGVSVKPTSDWLDRVLAEIRERHTATPTPKVTP